MAGAERMTIEEVVRRVLREEHGDVIRESVRVVAQELLEAEVSESIGAQRGERSEARATHRNGSRSRRGDTRAGEIELQIPKIRQGSYFPSFPAAAQAMGAGAGMRGAAGVCLWRLDAAHRYGARGPHRGSWQPVLDAARWHPPQRHRGTEPGWVVPRSAWSVTVPAGLIASARGSARGLRSRSAALRRRPASGALPAWRMGCGPRR
jgi:Transposase, Mutator family